MKCYVCGKGVSFMGWNSHVKAEKRKHGENVYLLLRREREALKGKKLIDLPFKVGPRQQKLVASSSEKVK